MENERRGYFQPQQAVEVARSFAKHLVDYMFIGKSGAILLGFPAATQDVDLFPRKSRENGQRIVEALREIGFEIGPIVENEILANKDFVQIKNGPFDLDLIFAPDGIEDFDEARGRMIILEGFPIANLSDIIASKKAAGRVRDLLDLPLLEEFKEEYEKRSRSEPESAIETATERTKDLLEKD